MKLSGRFVAIPLATSMLWAGSAFAADSVLINSNPSPRAVSASELVSARPMTNPLAAPDASGIRANSGEGAGVPGAIGGGSSASTRAFGSFGIPYTSTRVRNGGTAYTSTSIGPAFLSTTDPYRRVGKLFIGGGRYCSASLIRRSVIVTAAHCIQRFGTGSSIFGGYTFFPGHYGPAGATATQIAPYSSYTWRALVRPNTWANGTDRGCGSARDNDLAVIALNKDDGVFIGDRTGYLGYGWNNYSSVVSSRTGNLRTFATSTLGYPALMDSGKIMQRADGPSYTTTVCTAGQIWQGNNFTGGSSGGPWVVNFVSFNPVLTGGAVIGTAPGMSVIGVTSWGTADPNAPKDNYSSQFRQNTRYPAAAYGAPNRGAGNIGSLLATLCMAANPGGGTYQSNGYCD